MRRNIPSKDPSQSRDVETPVGNKHLYEMSKIEKKG